MTVRLESGIIGECFDENATIGDNVMVKSQEHGRQGVVMGIIAKILEYGEKE